MKERCDNFTLETNGFPSSAHVDVVGFNGTVDGDGKIKKYSS